MTLEAVVRDADGNRLTNRDVQWSVDNPTIASINQNGTVTGKKLERLRLPRNRLNKTVIPSPTAPA